MPRDNSQPAGLESKTVNQPSSNIFRSKAPSSQRCHPSGAAPMGTPASAGALQKLRSVVALVLMLWCAGAGCILVTSARATTADLEIQSASEGEGSTGSHSSCHGSKPPAKAQKTHSNPGPAGINRLSLPAMPTPSGAMSCCPLTSGSIATPSRVQTNDDHLTVVSHDELSYLPLATRGTTPLAIPLRLPNQDQTYLRCCVFLI